MMRWFRCCIQHNKSCFYYSLCGVEWVHNILNSRCIACMCMVYYFECCLNISNIAVSYIEWLVWFVHKLWQSHLIHKSNTYLRRRWLSCDIQCIWFQFHCSYVCRCQHNVVDICYTAYMHNHLALVSYIWDSMHSRRLLYLYLQKQYLYQVLFLLYISITTFKICFHEYITTNNWFIVCYVLNNYLKPFLLWEDHSAAVCPRMR